MRKIFTIKAGKNNWNLDEKMVLENDVGGWSRGRVFVKFFINHPHTHTRSSPMVDSTQDDVDLANRLLYVYRSNRYNKGDYVRVRSWDADYIDTIDTLMEEMSRRLENENATTS